MHLSLTHETLINYLPDISCLCRQTFQFSQRKKSLSVVFSSELASRRCSDLTAAEASVTSELGKSVEGCCTWWWAGGAWCSLIKCFACCLSRSLWFCSSPAFDGNCVDNSLTGSPESPVHPATFQFQQCYTSALYIFETHFNSCFEIFNSGRKRSNDCFNCETFTSSCSSRVISI